MPPKALLSGARRLRSEGAGNHSTGFKSLDNSLDVSVNVGIGIDLVAGRLLDQRVGDFAVA
jgi:hypothetical protein